MVHASFVTSYNAQYNTPDEASREMNDRWGIDFTHSKSSINSQKQAGALLSVAALHQGAPGSAHWWLLLLGLNEVCMY